MYLEIYFTNINKEIIEGRDIPTQHYLMYRLSSVKKINKRINIYFTVKPNPVSDTIETGDINRSICNLWLNITQDDLQDFNKSITQHCFRAIEYLLELKGVDTTQLEQVKEQAVNEGFKALIPRFKKGTLNDKKQLGELYFDFQPQYAEPIFKVFDSNRKKNCIAKMSLGKVDNNFMILEMFYRHLVWENGFFTIVDQSKQIKLVIDYENEKSFYAYSPLGNTEEQLKRFLKRLDYSVQSNKEEFIYFMQHYDISN